MTWLSDGQDSSRRLPMYRKGFDLAGLSKMFRFGRHRLLRKEQMGTSQGTLGRKEERNSGLLLSIGVQPFAVEDQRPLFIGMNR